MEMRRLKKALSLFLCMALCVAMTLMTTGCGDKSGNANLKSTSMVQEMSAHTVDSQEKGSSVEDVSQQENNVTVLGDGETTFLFSVMDKESSETSFEIHTNQKTVGAALLELDLIAGEEGPFGLYVKTVNGITLDYDKDKAYWAFYENDAYASTGVDLTEIAEGDSYSFRIEK